MIKLFISDLDGTLLGMNHYMKSEDIQAIQELTAGKVQLAVASGRMDHEINEVLKRMEVSGHRVSQNGAFVYDHESNNIHSKTFDESTARKVMEDMEEVPLLKTVSTADRTYTPKHSKWIDVISEQLFHDIIVDPNMIEEFGKTIHPSKISLHGREEEVIVASRMIDKKYGQNLDSFVSHETCVDMMPKAINKGTGIKALLQEINIKPEEIACVGDSFNDLSMFELTPHSYAMSTARPEVKERASQVVDHVHEAIEDLEKKGLL